MMITGDHHHTAIAVAREIGMLKSDSPTVIIDTAKHGQSQLIPQQQIAQGPALTGLTPSGLGANAPIQRQTPEVSEVQPEHSLEAQLSMASNVAGLSHSRTFFEEEGARIAVTEEMVVDEAAKQCPLTASGVYIPKAEQAIHAEEEEAILYGVSAGQGPTGPLQLSSLQQQPSQRLVQLKPRRERSNVAASGKKRRTSFAPADWGSSNMLLGAALPLEDLLSSEHEKAAATAEASCHIQDTALRGPSTRSVKRVQLGPLAWPPHSPMSPANSSASVPTQSSTQPNSSQIALPPGCGPPSLQTLPMPSAQDHHPLLGPLMPSAHCCQKLLNLFTLHRHEPQPLLTLPCSPQTNSRPALAGLRFVSAQDNQDCEAATIVTALAEGQLQCAVTGDAFDHMLQLEEVSLLESVMRNAVVFARMKPHQKGQVMDLLGSTGMHQICDGQAQRVQVRPSFKQPACLQSANFERGQSLTQCSVQIYMQKDDTALLQLLLHITLPHNWHDALRAYSNTKAGVWHVACLQLQHSLTLAVSHFCSCIRVASLALDELHVCTHIPAASQCNCGENKLVVMLVYRAWGM